MKYIANWETVQQRHTAFWEREVIDIFFVAMTEYYTPMNGKVVFKENMLVLDSVVV